MRKSPWTTTGSRAGGRCSRSHQSPSSIAGCGSPTASSSSTSRSIVAASRNGSRSGGRAWIFASSSAICVGSPSGTGSRTIRRPIVSPSSRSITNASRPARSSMYTTGRGTLTPASWAARNTSNSCCSESMCRWITPPPARRTSSRSSPASTAHASFDAPPGSSSGSEIGPSTASSASRMSAIIAAMEERRERVRAFMEEHVYPNERALTAEDDAADALVSELQQKARDAGLWAPHLPPEAGGSGSGFLEYADLNEEIGRSFIAQLIFGCQAPDAGNAEILHLYGNDEQKERFLRPLVAGEVRSFFGMTEPEVAGSDPTLLRGRGKRDGDEWVIDAHKWFSSGADGAAFGIVMVVTEPDAEPHKRASMILVPTDTPGYELVRRIPVMGHEGRGWNTHCETRFTGVRVPVANTLGEPGDGFKIAQKRLGPGRIHHVMRWLGQMQRAFELMCTYSLARETHGGPLADKQTVQNWIADSYAEIQACRLMTLDAAHKIDGGAEARVEISAIKFFAANVLQNVIDRAVQVHGARGLTDETPLANMLMQARGGRIYDGPDEVHRQVVAKRILKAFAGGEDWHFA